MTVNNAFLYRMPAGIPGAISRSAGIDVASKPANPSLPFAAYGLGGKMAAGKFVPIASGDLASALYGILSRPFPIGGVNASDALGVAVPPNSGILTPMRRGHMTVLLNAGSAVDGGAVYMRNGNPSGAKVIGGFEAVGEAVGALVGGATGNGTISTPAVTATAVPGQYRVTMLTATTFRVEDPNGVRLKDGATGVAYSAEGISFTITVGATPFVAGDAFTVSQNTFVVPNASFMGPADAAGNVEIAYNI